MGPTPPDQEGGEVNADQEAAVRFDQVSRTYGSGPMEVAALREVSPAFGRGSFTAVMGPSGSGKSTLLHCGAGLDRPTEGSVWIGGADLAGMSQAQLAVLRRDRVGVVFQAFNLVPSLTAEQNVVLPARLGRRRPERARVREVFEQVGLTGRERRRPAELSGGQQQRVAIARALLSRPEVVFADEPTGALDRSTGREVLALLREAVDTHGQTVVMVTHDPDAAVWADRVLFLTDGQVVDELDRPSARQVSERLGRAGGRL
jgi:putative ABC transport system ATP-binding protein